MELLSPETCDIGKYIENVVGLPSNSSSPTDTMIVTFKDKVLYDDVPVKKAFLKIFVDKIYDGKGNLVPFDILGKTLSLPYEQKIYELTRMFIRLGFCPYFINTYLVGNDCKLEQYSNIISKIKDVDEKNAKFALTRSLFYMISKSKDRPAIDDFREFRDIEEKNVEIANFLLLNRILQKNKNIPVIKYLQSNNALKDFDYYVENNTRINYIMNEAIEDAYTLDEWKNFYNLNYKFRDKVSEDEFIYMVFFQISIALYTMYLFEMNHNDLHPGNIYITQKTPHMIRYKIDDQIYIFNDLGIKVKIFDFDFSYCYLLGDNSFLDSDMRPCKDYELCNHFVKNRDMLRLFVGGRSTALQDYLSRNQKRTLSKIISSQEAVVQYIENRTLEVSDAGAAYIADPLDIVKNTSKLLDVKVRDYDEKKDRYDYHISSSKAFKAIQIYKKFLKPFFALKISATNLQKISQLRDKYVQKKLSNEDYIKEVEKIIGQKPSKEERETTLQDFRIILGQRPERTKSISEEELE